MLCCHLQCTGQKTHTEVQYVPYLLAHATCVLQIRETCWHLLQEKIGALC